jgi:hypothetical protein
LTTYSPIHLPTDAPYWIPMRNSQNTPNAFTMGVPARASRSCPSAQKGTTGVKHSMPGESRRWGKAGAAFANVTLSPPKDPQWR